MQHIRNYRGLHTSRKLTTLTWLSNRQLIRIDEESNHGSLMLETTAEPTLPQPVPYIFKEPMKCVSVNTDFGSSFNFDQLTTGSELNDATLSYEYSGTGGHRACPILKRSDFESR